MVNKGVHNPIALLVTVHGGGEVHDQPVFYSVQQKTVNKSLLS